jgi:hypothetical protein
MLCNADLILQAFKLSYFEAEVSQVHVGATLILSCPTLILSCPTLILSCPILILSCPTSIFNCPL